ncbi:gamma-aminobutyrate transaminase POP2 [Cucumis melo var. makuwa]|uniref:Gamma-aminobutyrate transaminase POP2 n=1 Tax=Cucumis melo var. makuwa TaxID=1194695 RepID=A0A5D3BFB8_CUCMM|nr:gamma-aminobutyrate transaminase POP2 [Cucumis melo var. makuwa]
MKAETGTMSSFPSSFNKMDVMFLKFVDDLDNPMGGSSSVDDNSGISQPSATPTPRRQGTQPLSRNEICETVLGRQPTYSKGLGWGPKPKAHKTASASNSTTSCSQSTVKLQLRVALDKAMLHIEEQTRNHVALASEVERMQKLKDDMS